MRLMLLCLNELLPILMDRLNDLGKALNGAKILILGIAYKKNVGDMRESPSFELIEILRDNGAVVS